MMRSDVSHMKIIDVKGLKKTYKEVEAVKGIDFTIHKGEFVALLGPNGAGKTTTINILCTILEQYYMEYQSIS